MGATLASSQNPGPRSRTGREPEAIDSGRLRHSMAVLVNGELSNSTTRKKLLRVVTLATETFRGCYAAVTVQYHEGEVCTNSAAYHLDQAQYRSGKGPSAAAVASLQAVRVDAIATCPWQEFRRAAAEQRIASSLSIPLIADGTAIGVLNLYAREAGAFAGCEDAAAAFAAASAVLLSEGHD